MLVGAVLLVGFVVAGGEAGVRVAGGLLAVGVTRTPTAIEALPADGTLVQLNARVPALLLPRLEERGWAWEVGKADNDVVRVFMRRARNRWE